MLQDIFCLLLLKCVSCFLCTSNWLSIIKPYVYTIVVYNCVFQFLSPFLLIYNKRHQGVEPYMIGFPVKLMPHPLVD
nr:MAG TPA: hypothetical protein [Caudoviricetes sp.]